ncbi:MAG: CHASE2 domain-containing protein [Pseudomonadota bacterium]
MEKDLCYWLRYDPNQDDNKLVDLVTDAKATQTTKATATWQTPEPRALSIDPDDCRVPGQSTVVLIDDQSLASWDTVWPLSYAKHAHNLRQIMKHEPKAVFVDIRFDIPRTMDNTLENTKEYLKSFTEVKNRETGQVRHIPLLFSVGDADYRNRANDLRAKRGDEYKSRVWESLAGSIEPTVTGWTYAVDDDNFEYRRQGLIYQLYSRPERAKAHPDREDKVEKWLEPSAALELYILNRLELKQQSEQKKDTQQGQQDKPSQHILNFPAEKDQELKDFVKDNEADMFVRWGVSSPTPKWPEGKGRQIGAVDDGACRFQKRDIGDKIYQALTLLLRGTFQNWPLPGLVSNEKDTKGNREFRQTNCFFVPTLRVHKLGSAGAGRNPNFKKMIENRYVFYGAWLRSSGDRVWNPINGEMPGVFTHAMAFENLLKYEGNTHVPLEPSADVIIYIIFVLYVIFATALATLIKWPDVDPTPSDFRAKFNNIEQYGQVFAELLPYQKNKNGEPVRHEDAKRQKLPYIVGAIFSIIVLCICSFYPDFELKNYLFLLSILIITSPFIGAAILIVWDFVVASHGIGRRSDPDELGAENTFWSSIPALVFFSAWALFLIYVTKTPFLSLPWLLWLFLTLAIIWSIHRSRVNIPWRFCLFLIRQKEGKHQLASLIVLSLFFLGLALVLYLEYDLPPIDWLAVTVLAWTTSIFLMHKTKSNPFRRIAILVLQIAQIMKPKPDRPKQARRYLLNRRRLAIIRYFSKRTE